MRTAHYDSAVAFPELAGNIVAADRVYRPARDRNHVGRIVEIDFLDLFVNQGNMPVGRCDGGEVRERQRNQLTLLRFENCPVPFGNGSVKAE